MNMATGVWEDNNNIVYTVVLGSRGHNRACASVQEADLCQGTYQTTIPILFPAVKLLGQRTYQTIQ